MSVEYFFVNHDEEVWRTISVVTIDGVPHAYQQKRVLVRPKYENNGSRGMGSSSSTFGSEMVETDEHRFVPVADTISDEEKEKLIEGFISDTDQ